MRVTKTQVAANRDALLQAAGRLFREHGIDGVGVAEIGKRAGMTHGALYRHFPTKDALAAEAYRAGVEQSLAMMLQAVGDAPPTLGRYLDFLLSPAVRDELAMGCPMTASASEIGRQGEAVSASFRDGVGRMVAALAASMDSAMPDDQRRGLAFTAVAAQLGAIVISRAVAKTDMALADDVLTLVRASLEVIAREHQPDGCRESGKPGGHARGMVHGARPKRGTARGI